MINWKQKLSSRKFWAMLAGFITGILLLLNIADAQIEKISAIIGTFGSIIVYILGETYIDSKGVKK